MILKARILAVALLVLPLAGCIGTAIETTTDAAIAVGKIPFKVGGAVVDVATGDDDKGDEEADKGKE
ncbi:MAG: hypothetical protein HKN59_09490 [Gammaproteobacteria bacterium]|nr:hypothetical protein [Gammaproteobacteria bacterium]